MQCRDALPPQNPGRSFESDYNEHIRASAFQAIYRDHLRESALRDDIAGVGHETFPPIRYMIETSSFESFMIIEFTLINLLGQNSIE